jgi:hypothetical protein
MFCVASISISKGQKICFDEFSGFYFKNKFKNKGQIVSALGYCMQGQIVIALGYCMQGQIVSALGYCRDKL